MMTKLPELLPRKEAAGGGTRGGLKIWIRRCLSLLVGSLRKHGPAGG